jgi:hypothetical protein
VRLQDAAARIAYLGVSTSQRALRPAAGAVGLARRGEVAVRRRAAEQLGQTTIILVDRGLDWRYIDMAVQHVVESALAERTVARALDRVEMSGLPQLVADRLLADGFAERLAARILEGPELERIVERALGSPGTERIAAMVVESAVVQDAIDRIVDNTVERLRDSPAMWSLLEDVMHSPAVAEAITQQGMGFADQVGDEVRDRSRSVDDKLERVAWRLLRRRSRPATESPST